MTLLGWEMLREALPGITLKGYSQKKEKTPAPVFRSRLLVGKGFKRGLGIYRVSIIKGNSNAVKYFLILLTTYRRGSKIPSPLPLTQLFPSKRLRGRCFDRLYNSANSTPRVIVEQACHDRALTRLSLLLPPLLYPDRLYTRGNRRVQNPRRETSQSQ